MAPSKVLFSFLVSFLLVVMLVKKVESQNTSFAINTFTPHSLLLTYERDAFVPPDQSSVRLMAVNGSGWPRTQSVGRVLYRTPVDLWASGRQASFETTITLQIDPAGPLSTATLGHGITFFMVPVNSTRPTGGSGVNLGIYDAVPPGTPVFAVEFDHATRGLNPEFAHIGININSQRSQNLTRASGMIWTRVIARITYDAPTRMINVEAKYGNDNPKVSLFFNLAAIFPQRVQFGLSASTGTLRIGYLDVHTWHFNSTMVPDVISVRKNNTDIKPYEM